MKNVNLAEFKHMHRTKLDGMYVYSWNLKIFQNQMKNVLQTLAEFIFGTLKG